LIAFWEPIGETHAYVAAAEAGQKRSKPGPPRRSPMPGYAVPAV